MPGFLLDTNVISELMRQEPEPMVASWVSAIGSGNLHLCAPVYGEIQTGILRLAPGRRRSKLAAGFEQLVLSLFGDGVLTFDRKVAEIWARLMADGAATGRVRPELDMQIAAIALAHGLILVTRDTFHFEEIGVPLHRPWPVDATS